ncbi:DNA-directed RNA polymerase V subunit 1 [Dorcoceras hygrometricum]|uniref:DNA-directed RNA polymerase V subunit 1 n=1 Tax=Dorcoceras hygrometricum TaxID=472368 RepID=A0A2Z7AU89_9LAMI|nr:DNA-directed RNA polymerase V subunit 1 [Dorcoceras hygrometricum]
MHRCRGFTARRHAWISYAILGDNSVQISGQSTTSVLGKCVYLVTLAMSLFDLQDVCIAIGSLATLDLPMVVDLIGIYGLKGPYSTLTTTNWFLQALSVIPRGSWGDVTRRFTMIRWADYKTITLSTKEPPSLLLSSLKPPPAVRRRPSSPENRFRPIRRGESVRADLVSPSSIG